MTYIKNLSEEGKRKIAEYLKDNILPIGLGTYHNACSIAAINLALTGELTDSIPNCMDLAIGNWIISVQDSMPDHLRNSKEWKLLLPEAAGTYTSSAEIQDARDKILWKWRADVVFPIFKSMLMQAGMDEYAFKTIQDEIRKHGAPMRSSVLGFRLGVVLEKVGLYSFETFRVPEIYLNVISVRESHCNNQMWEHVNPAKVLEELIDAGKTHAAEVIK